MTRIPTESLISPHKCKIHRTWIKKGVCSICERERMQALSQYKQERGIKEVPIKVIKL